MVSSATAPLPDVDLIVACTKRKHAHMHPAMRMAAMPVSEPSTLATTWLRRAARCEQVYQVQQLYCGAGWEHGLGALESLRRLGVARLHVMSAGFGLLCEDAAVPSYGATFADGDDQVAKRVQGGGTPAAKHRAWWHAINEARSQPQPLASRLEGGLAIYAVGYGYLSAAADDLAEQIRRVGVQRVWIVCCGSEQGALPAEVSASLLPIGIEVEGLLPGVRSDLNTRVLAWLAREALPETGWDRDALAAWLKGRLAGVRRPAREARTAQTDQQVMAWLRAAAGRGRTLTGAMIREYRQAGWACEQGRFARLVRETVAELAGEGQS